MNSTIEARQNTEVVGFLAGNWPGYNEATPALVVNPAASPLDLLAWCWAEVQSLSVTVSSLSGSPNGIEPGDVSAILSHRLQPLANMLHQATTELVAEERKRASTSNLPCSCRSLMTRVK